ARIGLPRWRNELARPAVTSTRASAMATSSDRAGNPPVNAESTTHTSTPYPAPDAVVKKMTDSAGCMSARQHAVEPRRDATTPARGRWVGRGRFHRVVAPRAPRPRRQVAVDRLVPEFRHQRDAATLGDQFRHIRLRVAQVAEVARTRRADLHAGRLALGLGEVLVVDAVHAERALLHDALDLAVLARAVRAGPRAQLAADALVLVHQHDAVLGALVAGAGRAHGHAGRRLAVQAR